MRQNALLLILLLASSGQLAEAGSDALTTKQPVTAIDLRTTLPIGQDATAAAWETAVAALENQNSATVAADRARTETCWRQFPNRSHIVINPGKTAADGICAG